MWEALGRDVSGLLFFVYLPQHEKGEAIATCDPKMKEARKAMMLTSLLAICVLGEEFIVGRGNAPVLHGAGDKRDNVHNRRRGRRCNT